MTKKRKAAVAALATAVAVSGGGGCTLAVGSHNSSSRQYCAEMPDAVGLYAGNPVTQMGFTVGKVDEVVSKGDHVEVTFALNGGRRYPPDVKAVTRSKSLLADRSLELVGNYVSGPQLTRDKCIALDHTFVPKSISQIAGSAADFIDAVAPSNGKQSLQNALSGLDAALNGNGKAAETLMRNAASAMSSPDQMIADFGTAIVNMAPLTDESLRNWSSIRSVLDQAPTVVSAVPNDLLPGVTKLSIGTGWVIKVLYDIQQHYADLLWPAVHVGLTSVIHLAATRSKDIASLLESIPSIAAFMRQQANDGATGLTMAYAPPNVQVDGGGPVAVTSLLDLVLEKGSR
ncbi:MlaD family protein [Nocardia sp. NPDC052278]|uniref:MlaD family protein n=1 Tax=unclassified Nocardia TaxID=2637762 RepID=UPI003676105E